MTKISTKLSIKFYFAVALFFIIGTMPLLPIIIGLPEKKTDNKEFMVFFGIVICILGFSMFYAYLKNSPKVTIDKDTIKIGYMTFYVKNIKDIVLTGKRALGIIPMESITILFDNGKKKVLFDDMYSNSSDIKLFLEQVVINKQEYNPILLKNINKNMIRFEKEETFRGNQFINIHGILLWGVIGFFIFAIFSWIERQILTTIPLIFSVVYCTGWFFSFSYLMHYFGLTKDYLIIKNSNFIWMAKIYCLSDIKEVVFEQQGRSPNGMRVITTDFKKKLYIAAPLRKKTWLEMKRELEQRGIKVRDEIF